MSAHLKSQEWPCQCANYYFGRRVDFLAASGLGQSLGDVARAQRQKQGDKPASSAHKVITDEDIPAHIGGFQSRHQHRRPKKTQTQIAARPSTPPATVKN